VPRIQVTGHASRGPAPPPPVGLGPLLNTSISPSYFILSWPHFFFLFFFQQPSYTTTFTMSLAPPSYSPLQERPLKDTICLFDVDGTLTPARLVRQSSLVPWRSYKLLTIFQGRLPRDSFHPPEAPIKVCCRFRWRLRLPQAAGAAGQTRWPACHRPLRLLLLRERSHCFQARRAPRLKHLHQVHRRGAVQGTCQLRSPLHR
jgi:hypothetical protein